MFHTVNLMGLDLMASTYQSKSETKLVISAQANKWALMSGMVIYFVFIDTCTM